MHSYKFIFSEKAAEVVELRETELRSRIRILCVGARVFRHETPATPVGQSAHKFTSIATAGHVRLVGQKGATARKVRLGAF